MWQQFNRAFTGEWLQYGELFTILQTGVFQALFLLLLTTVPAVLLLHSMMIGPKTFNHHGQQVYFFSLFCRCIHWLAALTFSILVLSGIAIIFAKTLGGGSPAPCRPSATPFVGSRLYPYGHSHVFYVAERDAASAL